MDDQELTRVSFPNLYAPSKGYVFVSTYGRSGSTILMKLLNAIPGACIRGENNGALPQLIQAVLAIQHENNYLMRREQHLKEPAFRDSYWQGFLGTPEDPWYGIEGVNIEQFGRYLLEGFVRYTLRPPTGVTYLGLKDIHFYEFERHFDSILDSIAHFFPNCKFVFLTRDLDEVAKSGWWAKWDTKVVKEKLSRADELFCEYSKKSPNNSFLIDYASFRDGPSGVKGLLEFLGAQLPDEVIIEVLSKKLTHLK